MEFKERKLKGVFEITLNPIKDERGFFMRTYDDLFFAKEGLNLKWLQENHSRTENKDTIRGLHFQLPPFSESKLVRCIKGTILDVFVDLRENSESFGKWDAIELSEENKKMIFIPRGFAHGFCTLSEISEVVYKVDNVYSKQHELGMIWNDSDLKINWPTQTPTLSEKDTKNFTLKEFITKHNAIKL
jgi:dTDP-4-dehydrorhamnose 3,5-epimerase